jgi:3-oxoadipate enol-lactonase
MNVTSASGVDIAYQVTGSGDPVTCFVPGIAQTMSDTRAFGSGVSGSRVFMDLRGQGQSAAPAADSPEAWTFRAIADDVAAVAAETRASRALGVSMGAGALLDLAIRQPSRFDRLVLALPGAIDEPRTAEAIALTDRLADAVDANDQVALGRLLLELQPTSVRRRADVGMWARRHASEIGGTPVSRVLRALPRCAPVPKPEQLGNVEVPVLVLAQRGDPAHPVELAERLGSLLPRAEVVVSDVPWVWSGRQELRQVVGNFLNS